MKCGISEGEVRRCGSAAGTVAITGRGRPLVRRGAGGLGLALLIIVGAGPCASAQTGPSVPDTLPTMTIAPAGSGVSEAPLAPSGAKAAGASAPTASRRHRLKSHTTKPAAHQTAAEASPETAAEPATAHLRLIANSWAYARPDNRGARIEPVRSGKYVNVTGTTRYYLQVRLKSGKTAYVPYEVVNYVTPADRIFHLTADSPVLSAPNHAAKKLAEVHRGHDVQVVGVALTYMKIRMRDGREGFIPDSALE